MRQRARAPRVSPGGFPRIIASAGPGVLTDPIAGLGGGLALEEHRGDHAGDSLDGLAKLFPTDCLATEPVCIHDRFTLLSNPQETCVTT